MISSRGDWLDAAAEAMAKAFGAIDEVSETMDFDFTHYYDEAMGSPLYRRFVSFAKPMPPDTLAEAKLRTNDIEAAFPRRPGGAVARPVNLDIGYVERSKLVLASMKNFSHRVYLGRGVYAEVTMQYHAGRWQPLPWTFPDYASGRYDAFLLAVRDRLDTPAEREARS